jgi:hypothetical protein
MTKPLRACGPKCPTPDLPHRDPEPEWIGNTPILHGESDWQLFDERWQSLGAYCLCGHPNYMMCPGVWAEEDTIDQVTIRPPEAEFE